MDTVTADLDATVLPDPGAEPDPVRASRRREVVMSVTGLGAALLLAVLTVVPAPFAIGSPGPTFDTLGEADDLPLVEISGAPTFPPSGELWLTTVSVGRGGSTPFSLGTVLRGWVSPAMYVVPEEQVFGTADEERAVQEQAQRDWISSQDAASVAALEALGVQVPADLRVAQVDTDSLASGLLAEDDIIVDVDGVEVSSFAELTDHVGTLSPGDDVTVGYVRDGNRSEVTFATIDGGEGNALMGLWIDPQFDLPIDVDVHIDRVGGPSAGLMFSLAIMDMLTEEDELNGARVGGTGAISADGNVQAIGGVVMKMHGALDAGAEYFLTPVDNCGEVVGHIPDGLDVYAVDTLDDAYEVVLAIGSGDVQGLPTCTE